MRNVPPIKLEALEITTKPQACEMWAESKEPQNNWIYDFDNYSIAYILQWDFLFIVWPKKKNCILLELWA